MVEHLKRQLLLIYQIWTNPRSLMKSKNLLVAAYMIMTDLVMVVSLIKIRLFFWQVWTVQEFKPFQTWKNFTSFNLIKQAHDIIICGVGEYSEKKFFFWNVHIVLQRNPDKLKHFLLRFVIYEVWLVFTGRKLASWLLIAKKASNICLFLSTYNSFIWLFQYLAKFNRLRSFFWLVKLLIISKLMH